MAHHNVEHLQHTTCMPPASGSMHGCGPAWAHAPSTRRPLPSTGRPLAGFSSPPSCVTHSIPNLPSLCHAMLRCSMHARCADLWAGDVQSPKRCHHPCRVLRGGGCAGVVRSPDGSKGFRRPNQGAGVGACLCGQCCSRTAARSAQNPPALHPEICAVAFLLLPLPFYRACGLAR
jgi:hypothetical protein